MLSARQVCACGSRTTTVRSRSHLLEEMGGTGTPGRNADRGRRPDVTAGSMRTEDDTTVLLAILSSYRSLYCLYESDSRPTRKHVS